MGFRSEHYQRPYTPVSARTLNGLTQGINQLSRARRNPYLQPRGFWARLSGSSSPYQFEEVTGTEVMGIILWTTVPGGISGSTAVELNGVSGLDALVVFLESRDVLDGGSYIFEYPRRGSSGGGTNSGIPGCTCSPMPNTINMVSSKPASNNGIFQSATLQFGPTPGPLLPVVSAANSYLSTTTFFDTVLAVSFYYFLTCVTGQYVLTRVYETSPFGSPFRDSVRYKWTPGFPGNSCGPPFTMTNGQIFLGGDSSCIVTLSG